MADTRKFQLGMKLDNKRFASQSIRNMVSRAINRTGPQGFRTLLMPSPNMADIDEMTGHSIPFSNMVIAERDKASFKMIGSTVMCPSCARWVNDTAICSKCGAKKPVGLTAFRESAAASLTDSAMDLVSRLSYETSTFDYMNIDLCGPVSVRQHLKVVLKLSQCFSDRAILVATAKCARERGNMEEVNALCRKAEGLGLMPDGTKDGKRRLAMFALVVLAPGDSGWCPTTYIRAEYPGDGCRIRMLSYACEYEAGRMSEADARSLWTAQQDDRFSELSPYSIVVSGARDSWRRDSD